MSQAGRLGTTQCELIPAFLVKWVSHWNTLHTTQTPQTEQVGVPLEHTAHHPNSTNWTSGCPTGTHGTPPQLHKLDKWVHAPLEHVAHHTQIHLMVNALKMGLIPFRTHSVKRLSPMTESLFVCCCLSVLCVFVVVAVFISRSNLNTRMIYCMYTVGFLRGLPQNMKQDSLATTKLTQLVFHISW